MNMILKLMCWLSMIFFVFFEFPGLNFIEAIEAIKNAFDFLKPLIFFLFPISLLMFDSAHSLFSNISSSEKSEEDC